jgi:hypothetical protein
MKKKIIILAAIALGLTGCKEEETPEVVQSVEWYKEHPTERAVQLDQCKSDPGELALTPNCVNASRAQESTTWTARGGGIKKLAPLTAKDINK